MGKQREAKKQPKSKHQQNNTIHHAPWRMVAQESARESQNSREHLTYRCFAFHYAASFFTETVPDAQTQFLCELSLSFFVMNR
jgi:hypothetical protein